MLFADTLMAIPTGNRLLTVMLMLFEVAGFPEVQVSFDVNVQDITSPFAGI